MNSSKFRFTLDLHKTQSQVSIPVTRGDTARAWYISFSDGSLPYELADGCLAKLEIKRPTGTHIEAFCAIENHTTVKYEFSQNENTAAVEGIHECAVVLFGVDGDIIGSPRFTMIVSDRVINSDDVNLSDNDLSAIEAMVTAEAGRQKAELDRANAEASRIEAEKQREQNETARTSAETARSSSEAERNKNFAKLQDSVNTAAAALVSPTVTVTPIDGGHEVTITDKNGDKTFIVRNGTNGEGTQGTQGTQGPQGAPGKSAYDYALEGGFTGTAEEFAEKLAAVAALTVYNGETEDVV